MSPGASSLRGRGFRPGAVAAAHADRTYCVAYDDGDLEDRVPADRVRRRAAMVWQP